MGNKKCIHIWVSEKTFDKVRKYADDNNRSVSNAATYLLENIADGLK